MVKLDLHAYNGLSLEKVEEMLAGYYKKGFRWEKNFLTNNIKVEMPKRESEFSQRIIYNNDILNYFENIKLEICNREHIEMLYAAELLAILYNYDDFPTSDNFLSE